MSSSIIRSVERTSWGRSLAPGYMHSCILTPGVGLSSSVWRKTMLTSISAGVVVVVPGGALVPVNRSLLAYVTAWGFRWL